MINMSNRIFQFWEYKVSHGSLLIRSPMKEEQQYNIDIKFFLVVASQMKIDKNELDIFDSVFQVT